MVVEQEYTGPNVDRLKVHASPGGRLITTLGKKDDTISAMFEVVERKDDWTRVRFETDMARFDVWARSSELDADAGGLAGLGLGGCGMSRCGGGPPNLSKVVRRTAVIVGDGPDHQPSPGLALIAGAYVVVLSERGSYVEVRGHGSRIGAPDGTSFWIPKSALTDDLTES
jgi:hypothetical protein